MEEIWLPDEIQSIVQDKPCEKNNIGMSDSQVFMYDDMVLKIQAASEETENEVCVCRWLKDRIPVPRIEAYCVADKKAYSLMSRIYGKMACDETYMENPVRLLDIVTKALQMLWNVDIADCPCDNSLSVKLAMARYNVENGLVDLDNVEPETFGENGFASPAELLRWLEDNRPEEDLVFSHGDFCLPNLFADGDRVTGFIDLGKMGVADRWQDIALCYRSLKHNFEGKYNGGKVYGGYYPEMLFERLGVKPDWEKLKYYILLDELF
ncbi:MAG: aminoglycoside 3'-phosphotransferase [Lachnospiraceae bacterium]|nr:aminoglycoside 3'-phosphotransferase [Lachnospiraceae bacterium]